MPIKKVEETFAMDITKGKEHSADGNTFIPYYIPAISTEPIQKAYLHVKLQHPSARHIVCAYRIPGYPVHEYNDYQDDEEHGCGSKLIQVMEKNNLTHCAIFIARYCSTKKIGEDRFKVLLDLQTTLRRKSHHQINIGSWILHQICTLPVHGQN